MGGPSAGVQNFLEPKLATQFDRAFQLGGLHRDASGVGDAHDGVEGGDDAGGVDECGVAEFVPQGASGG